jgi:lysophospholipase L1-like esterase
MKDKLILLIISVVISLAFAEIIFRATGKHQTYNERTDTGGYVSPFVVGFYTWYRVHPAYQKIEADNREFHTSLHFNNEGFNDQAFSTSRTCSIMIMGDSFTEGIGATRDSSYPRQLEYLIGDSSGEKGLVWNCGIGGSDIIFEYVLFRDKLLKYKPDMVIVTVNNTDIGETMLRGGFERFDKDGTTHYRKAPWFEPLFAHSFLVRRIVFDVFHYNWQFIRANEEQSAHDTAVAQLISAVDSFAILSSEKKFKLLFDFHPMQAELEKKETYFAGPFIAHCREHGYDYVDSREQFYKMGIDTANAAFLYWKEDGHFNGKGYNYLAKSVWGKVATVIGHDDPGASNRQTAKKNAE